MSVIFSTYSTILGKENDSSGSEVLFSTFTLTDSGNHSTLDSKPARRQWETTFNQTYIQPVTEALDHNIHAAFRCIVNDSEEGICSLMTDQFL